MKTSIDNILILARYYQSIYTWLFIEVSFVILFCFLLWKKKISIKILAAIIIPMIVLIGFLLVISNELWAQKITELFLIVLFIVGTKSFIDEFKKTK